jgi:hypothetical protein
MTGALVFGWWLSPFQPRSANLPQNTWSLANHVWPSVHRFPLVCNWTGLSGVWILVVIHL